MRCASAALWPASKVRCVRCRFANGQLSHTQTEMSTSKNLKTSACTAAGCPHLKILEIFKKIPTEVMEKFYGCCAQLPLGIDGLCSIDVILLLLISVISCSIDVILLLLISVISSSISLIRLLLISVILLKLLDMSCRYIIAVIFSSS